MISSFPSQCFKKREHTIMKFKCKTIQSDASDSYPRFHSFLFKFAALHWPSTLSCLY